MRFRELRAPVFGPLRGFERSLAPGVVLLFGRNESGKSSFCSALETILYGFEPASRDAHPLVAWNEPDPEDLHIEAEIELDSGRAIAVERVLQSSGKSRICSADESFAGRRGGNVALPELDALPRPIFRSLYSLELAQLAELERGVRTHVDDLLLPAAAQPELRPAREVREDLERDHLALWRADNRGKPEIKRLRNALSDASARVGEATRMERELRAQRNERAASSDKLEELRERRRLLDRDEQDAPYLQQLHELERHSKRLGEPVDLSELEGDLLIDPSSLGEEVELLEEQLREPRNRCAKPEVTISEADRRVLTRKPDIESALASGPECEALRRRASERAEGALLLRAGALRELGGLVAGAPAKDELECARTLPLEALRSAQADWAGAWEAHSQAIPESPARAPIFALAVGLLGLGLSSGGIVLGLPVAWTLLGIGVALGALLVAFFARGQVPENRALPERPDLCVSALGEIAIEEQLLASPAALLRALEALARVQAGAEDAVATEAEERALRERLAEREGQIRGLCRSLELDESGEGELPLVRLRHSLERARKAEADASKDLTERNHAGQLEENVTPTLERKLAQLQRLERTLRAAEPDAVDLTEAYARVQSRLEDARFAKRRQAELEHDPRWDALRQHPSVREARTSDSSTANASLPPWQSDVSLQRRAELAELDMEIEETNTRLGALSEILDNDEGSAVARARDEVARLQEEARTVERKRDRLALLEAIVARAEREYRDAHQPDVIRRAGRYLARLTHGRYTRLDYLSDEEGGLHVKRSDITAPIRVAPPLSRGTLDQIFLCLRFGLIDHLDEGRERLPLILDDALLRMDDARRRASLELLGELAVNRQIFVLTCHESLAREVEEVLRIHRIEIDPAHTAES